MLFGNPQMRRWLDQLLHTHDTPQRTAAAYAVGVFFGFSPFLGLHTILGLVVAFAFGLNRVAVLLGIYSNLPWILPAYYSLTTLLGAALLRIDVPEQLLKELLDSLTHLELREMWWLAKPLLTDHLKPLLWAYGVGSTIGALVLALVGYRVSLAMIVAHRKRLAAEEQGPPT